MYRSRFLCLSLVLFFLLFPLSTPVFAQIDLKDDVEIIRFAYDPQQPQAGEVVEMSGAVHNRSSVELQVELAFLAGGEKIHSLVVMLKPGEQRDVALTWRATRSVPSIELSVERAESTDSDGGEIGTTDSSGTISSGGRWEGDTSLTAEDVQKIKNWPDNLMRWIDKVWTTFSNWLNSLFD